MILRNNYVPTLIIILMLLVKLLRLFVTRLTIIQGKLDTKLYADMAVKSGLMLIVIRTTWPGARTLDPQGAGPGPLNTETSELTIWPLCFLRKELS